MTELPHATLEETFRPDEVVVVAEDDGATHVLLYAGRRPGGFTFLKRVVLDGEHARNVTPILEQKAKVAVEIPPEHDDTECCSCGALVMSSGWCTAGHKAR